MNVNGSSLNGKICPLTETFLDYNLTEMFSRGQEECKHCEMSENFGYKPLWKFDCGSCCMKQKSAFRMSL